MHHNNKISNVLKGLILALILLVLFYVFFYKNEKEVILDIKSNTIKDTSKYKEVVLLMKAVRDTLEESKKEDIKILVMPNSSSMYIVAHGKYIKIEDFNMFTFLTTNKIYIVNDCNFYYRFKLSNYGYDKTKYWIYYSDQVLEKKYLKDVFLFEKISDNFYLVITKE